MAVEGVLEDIRGTAYFSRNISYWKEIPASPGSYAPFPGDLDPRLAAALNARGIARLFTHQRKAVEEVRRGRHVVVATPTASGKTLCYNLPVLDRILKDPECCALYLFPTKALSQDQVRELRGLSEDLPLTIPIAAYDGDTPSSARPRIRESARVVISNPDMLHAGILPHHPRWMRFFRSLGYVVIDEIHHYRGVFGSHLSNVIRRLKRICRFYGGDPRFILSSATIANPAEQAGMMIGEEVSLIGESGAPTSPKHFIFYNPPFLNRELGIRANPIKEATRLADRFLGAGVQTIIFAGSRQKTEILLSYLRDGQKDSGKHPVDIRGYRGGYLPEIRREIEKGLKEGNVKAVVSTNALELGIDIGSLDACLMVGYPGTIASTRQQAGRAGRRHGHSAAILVAGGSPLDQFIINRPDYFFHRDPEHGVIDPDNLAILVSHIKCAAFELPFSEGEAFGGRSLTEILDFLEDEGILHRSGPRWHWSRDSYPADDISLRSATSGNVTIHDLSSEGRIIGEVDFESAPNLIHPEAVYIQDGQEYFVHSLDLEEGRAEVRKVEVDYFTQAETESDLSVREVLEEDKGPRWTRNFGEVTVRNRVSGYRKVRYYTHENVGTGQLNLPESHLLTSAFWVVPEESTTGLPPRPGRDSYEAWKGILNLLMNVAPLFVMADRRDLKGHPQILSPDSSLPALFIYDNHPGGVGYSRKIFLLFDEVLKAADRTFETCPCSTGCPSCIGPPALHDSRRKETAREIMALLLGQ
jgi:DEAD/DEAH box helicase domain-containing protein